MSIDTSNKSGAQKYSETIDWESLVADIEGINYPFFIHDAYEFSKKTFKEDDTQGVYE